MKTQEFDLFENVELNNEEKEYFKYSNLVSEVIIKLISRRLELNMSQRELAEKTGIKQPMIARIEKFDSIPRLDTVIRIASALNMKLDLKLETNIYNDETIIQPNLIKDNSFYKANTLCEEITYNKKK